jgi:hypothetical protein
MAEAFPPEPAPTASSPIGARLRPNIWVITSVISAVLICGCFVMFFVVPVLLALTGNTVENIIPNIINGFATPTP